jgi:hypothetical protein
VIGPLIFFLHNFHVYCNYPTEFWLEPIDFGEPIKDDVSSKTMSQVYRIEVPGRPKFGSSDGPPRFVVIVEIPDRVISALENPGSPALQLKALGIAMNATWNQRVKFRNFQFSSWSSSIVEDANPGDYGAASYRTGDGSSAWIVESPLAPRHPSLTVAECQNARELPPVVV